MSHDDAVIMGQVTMICFGVILVLSVIAGDYVHDLLVWWPF